MSDRDKSPPQEGQQATPPSSEPSSPEREALAIEAKQISDRVSKGYLVKDTQAWDDFCFRNREQIVAALTPRAVEKAGEPVAWLLESGAGKEVFLYRHNAQACAAVQGGTITPLYATPSGADVRERAALEEARVYLLKYTAGFALKERALLAKIDAALSRPDGGEGR